MPLSLSNYKPASGKAGLSLSYSQTKAWSGSDICDIPSHTPPWECTRGVTVALSRTWSCHDRPRDSHG